MHCSKKAWGFTLLEMLIAIAILAIALAAAVRVSFSSADQAYHLKVRTQAEWVAENVLNTLLAEQIFPEPGSQSGQAIQGETSFIWRMEISIMPDNRFRRAEVKVFLPEDDQHALARQVSHVPRQIN